jgi:hypothetical protein
MYESAKVIGAGAATIALAGCGIISFWFINYSGC